MTIEHRHGLITRRTALAASSLLLPWAATGCTSTTARPLVDMDAYWPLNVPYVPTRMPTVQKMLEMGRVGKNDLGQNFRNIKELLQAVERETGGQNRLPRG